MSENYVFPTSNMHKCTEQKLVSGRKTENCRVFASLGERQMVKQRQRYVSSDHDFLLKLRFSFRFLDMGMKSCYSS